MEQMRKFCGKCGGPVDPRTGLCPRCDGRPRPKVNTALVILAAVLLLAGIFGALCYFEVIELPEITFFEDVKEGVSVLLGRDNSPEPEEEDEEPAEPEQTEETEAPDRETQGEEKAPETQGEEKAPETHPATEPETEPAPEPETEPAPEPETVPTTEAREYTLSRVSSPVAQAWASSTYPTDVATHYVENLLDNDATTNWAEDAAGYGIGEYVQFEFSDTYQLNSVNIRGGNRYSETRYYNNGRPQDVTLTFSDGTSQSFHLEDIMHSQQLTLEEPVLTSSLRITIDSVYEGSLHNNRDQDTCISDVSFEAYARVYE